MAKPPYTPAAGRLPVLLLAGAAVWWLTMRSKPAQAAAAGAAVVTGENRFLSPIQAGEDPYTRRKSDPAALISTAFTNPTPGGI